MNGQRVRQWSQRTQTQARASPQECKKEEGGHFRPPSISSVGIRYFLFFFPPFFFLLAALTFLFFFAISSTSY